MLNDAAQLLAEVGMQLSTQRSVTSCAEQVVNSVIELGLCEAAAFVGAGDLRDIRVDTARVPDIESLRPGEAVRCGDIVARSGEWIAVRVGDTTGVDTSWSGTLWVKGVTSEGRDLLGTLARQAGVGFMVVRERTQLHARQQHQQALVESGKSLSQHHDLDALLKQIVVLATRLVGAKYGALGIVNANGETLDQFITVGVDDETHQRIGSLPTGKGLLGVMIRDPRPLRLARLQDDARSSGFPEHHPPMESFLGVPIVTRSKVAGRLYLTEKIGSVEFSAEDEQLAVSLASQAGIAIDNAELYSELVAANARLREADQHKSSFLANMSHELRSPLNTIIGYTNLLLEESTQFDAEQVEDLETISHSSYHLLNLISDLLDLGRIDANRINLSLETVDARRMLDEAAAAVRPLVEDGVTLSVKPRADSVEVQADAARLHQMLLNILGNAVKFTRSGEIRCWIEADHDLVSFFVEDDGPGIPAEDIDRLFESFYQSQAALQRTPREREGAGLGLAITQQLAQLHDGNITIASQEGHGTKVCIELPRCGPKNQEVAES